MTTTIIVFAIYLLILFCLAIWSSRTANSMKNYYLAGKTLPPWVVAFSTNATGESGWLLLGLTGMGYAAGAQAFWVVAGEVIGIAGVKRPYEQTAHASTGHGRLLRAGDVATAPRLPAGGPAPRRRRKTSCPREVEAR